jgi:uncharacterized protein (TIGR02246 family)
MQSARAQAKSTSDGKAEIEALEKSFIAAFNAKNVDAIMALYAPGNQLYVFDVTPPRAYAGWEAYKKDWEQAFAENPGPISVRMVEQHITVVGPVAYDYSIQSASFTDKTGKKLDMVVRVTDIFRKMNGKWLIVHEHVSVPVDPVTGKADMLSKP